MKEVTKNTIMRWVISSVMTFLAGAFAVLLPEWNEITWDSIQDGSVMGLIFLAFRSGVKAVIELFVMWYSKK